jgi:hypothetical protein
MKWCLTMLVALDFGAYSDCATTCHTDLGLEAIGSLSNIALSTLLRLYQYSGRGDKLAEFRTALDNEALAENLVDTWAWLFFALNTSMTIAIIYKIL